MHNADEIAETRVAGLNLRCQRVHLRRAPLRGRERDLGHLQVEQTDEAAHARPDEPTELFGSDSWQWGPACFDTHFIFARYALQLTAREWRAYLNTALPDSPSSNRSELA